MMVERPRRLRATSAIRDLVRETTLSAADLVMPVFVCDGTNVDRPVSDLDVVRLVSTDRIECVLQPLIDKGLRAVLLFGRVDDSEKTEHGTAALNARGPVVRAIQTIRSCFPHVVVMSDVALDPYTTHGHDGIYQHGDVVNDGTVDVLCSMSVLHAAAGAHIIAPSDMMDGRIDAIRKYLDNNGYHHVSLMSYTAKYASCLYGPFRSILGSAPAGGGKHTYQMDVANGREAMRELRLDLDEGADIVMVKPAMWYLDIIQRFRQASDRPVAAYHTSGEAWMIISAASAGMMDMDVAVMESTISIKRAGADIIVTYFTPYLLNALQQAS